MLKATSFGRRGVPSSIPVAPYQSPKYSLVRTSYENYSYIALGNFISLAHSLGALSATHECNSILTNTRVNASQPFPPQAVTLSCSFAPLGSGREHGSNK